MQAILERSASEVRSNFSETLNDSQYRRPQFFTRNRTVFALLGQRSLGEILSTAIVDVNVSSVDGLFIATSETLNDIVASGTTAQEAIEAFAGDMLEYALDYYESWELYSNAPNRKAHQPYVLRALLMSDPHEAMSMLEVTYA